CIKVLFRSGWRFFLMLLWFFRPVFFFRRCFFYWTFIFSCSRYRRFLYYGFFSSVGCGSFYNALTLSLLRSTIRFLFAIHNGLFVEDFINEILLAHFFCAFNFKIFSNVQKFGNKHVVQLQNVVHKKLLFILIEMTQCFVFDFIIEWDLKNTGCE